MAFTALYCWRSYESGYGEWGGIEFNDEVGHITVNAIKVDSAIYSLKLILYLHFIK